jgi:pimeloyl-ACP methyl ester carboxylesterase
MMITDRVTRKAIKSELFSIECGSRQGPPILLIHGITGSHRYWNPVRNQLERYYRLLAPDLLGFGLSPKPHIHYTIEIFRDSLRNFLVEKRLECQKLILMGHSMGALIAAEYAAAYPAYVDKLVLIALPVYSNESTAHDIFWSGSPSYRNLLTTNTFSENLSQIKRSGFGMSLLYLTKIPAPVLLDSRRFTFRSLTSSLENCLLKYNPEPVLSRIASFPILALHGERDRVSLLDSVIMMQEKFPNIVLKIIRDSGHHIILTHASESIDEILDFLSAGKGAAHRISERRSASSAWSRLFTKSGKRRHLTG